MLATFLLRPPDASESSDTGVGRMQTDYNIEIEDHDLHETIDSDILDITRQVRSDTAMSLQATKRNLPM